MQAPFSAYLFYKRVGGPGDDAREEEYGQGLSGQQMVSRLPAAHRSQLRLVRRRFRQGRWALKGELSGGGGYLLPR
jgi:hypothetical protein